MLKYSRNLVLDLYDYSGHRLMNLYDNTGNVSGQAYDVFVVTERNGWKELTFSLPAKVKDDEGKDVDNFRLEMLKADYRIRLVDDFGVDWFLVTEHRITHGGDGQSVEVTAGHISQLLKYKNLELEFSDDEGNNIGTARELLETILEGTGWEPGVVYVFREEHGEPGSDGFMPEKKRSLKAEAKTGAFKLVTDMCELFEAKAIFNGEAYPAVTSDPGDMATKYSKYCTLVNGEFIQLTEPATFAANTYYRYKARTVDILPMNPFSIDSESGLPRVAMPNGERQGLFDINPAYLPEVVELHFGKNVNNVTRTLNTEDIVTSLNAYGSYGNTTDNYCGIDVADHKVYTWTAAQNYPVGSIVQFDIDDVETERYQCEVTEVAIEIGDELVFSLLDPASRMYLWNKTKEHAYFAEHGMLGDSLGEGTVTTEKNKVHNLMDFTYYKEIGLFTDDMLQKLAKYQQDIIPLYETINQAAANANKALSVYSEVTGEPDMARLEVTQVWLDDGYIHLRLDTENYENGVIYRSDFDEVKRDRFEWRCADALKDNGRATNANASVIYMIGTGSPTSWVKAYIKQINDIETFDNTQSYEVGDRIMYYGSFYECISATGPEDYSMETGEEFNYAKWAVIKDVEPETLTLWTSSVPADNNVEYFILGTNSMAGELGDYEAFDESAQESITDTASRGTAKHEVFYTNGAVPQLPTYILNYAWWWDYSAKKLYFCWPQTTINDQQSPVSGWAEVLITANEEPQMPNDGRNYYWYDWQKGLVYLKKDTSWVLVDTVEEKRIAKMFGTVYMNCLRRDCYREGLYEKYTFTADETLPVGNYYFDIDDARYWAFSPAQEVETGDSIVFDRKKNTLAIVHDGEVVEDGYQTKKAYSYVGVQYHPSNVLEDLSFVDGSITTSSDVWNMGNATTENEVWDINIATVGAEITTSRANKVRNTNGTYMRSGKIRVYPELTYSCSLPNDVDMVFFYDSSDRCIDSIQTVVNNENITSFTTPTGTKNIRLRTKMNPNSWLSAMGKVQVATSMVEQIAADNAFGTDDTRLNTLTTYLKDICTAYNINMTPTANDWSAVIEAANQINAVFDIHYEKYDESIIIEDMTYLKLPHVESGEIISLPNLIKKFMQSADDYFITYRGALKTAQEALKEAELDLMETLGDLYREGTWQDSSYVEGDEHRLYADALDNIREISRPNAKYDIDFLDTYGSQKDMEYGTTDASSSISWPDINITDLIHLHDPDIAVNEWAYIDKLEKCYDAAWKTKITINTDLSLIAQRSFTDVMKNIADVASQIGAKTSKYDSITSGPLQAMKLEGTISANKLLITGARSSWRTDENGSLVFESLDGSSAMMLNGAGILIAHSRNQWGDWDWRTGATGEGFSADEITTGTLSAERIAAHSITVEHIDNGFGASIDLSGNALKMQFETGDTSVGFVDANGIEIRDGAIDIESTGVVNLKANSTINLGTNDGSTSNSISLGSNGVNIDTTNNFTVAATGKVSVSGAKLAFGGQSQVDINSGGSINVAGGNIHVASSGTFTVESNNFSIDSSGNVVMKGSVTANEGYIGGDTGWEIISKLIKSADGTVGLSPGYSVTGDNNTYVMWAGNATQANAPFQVFTDGSMKSTSGVIGGWKITPEGLTSGDEVTDDPSTQADETAEATIVIKPGTRSSDVSLKIGNSFSVTRGGSMTASSGTIGGWDIGLTDLKSNDGTVGMAPGNILDDNSYSFWAGNATPASAPFYVKTNGAIRATSGVIGGWNIDANELTYTNASSQVMKLSPTSTGTTPVFRANHFKVFADGSFSAGEQNNFQVAADGTLNATGATIIGTITASDGSIGGWEIESDRLVSDDGTVGISPCYTSSSVDYTIWAGNATPANAPFYVKKDGAIKASSGTIGGWTISATKLSYNNNAILLDPQATGNNPVFKAGSNFEVTSSGALTAKSGTIGGWAIGATTLSYNNNNNEILLAPQATGNDPVFKAGQNFSVKRDGTLSATGASIDGSLTVTGTLQAGSNFTVTSTGTLTAKNGTIGDWTIDSSSLRNNNSTIVLSATGTTVIKATDQFTVTNAGKLTAKNVDIKGAIEANSGLIGRWNITNNAIYNNSVYLYSPSTDSDQYREYNSVTNKTIRFAVGAPFWQIGPNTGTGGVQPNSLEAYPRKFCVMSNGTTIAEKIETNNILIGSSLVSGFSLNTNSSEDVADGLSKLKAHLLTVDTDQLVVGNIRTYTYIGSKNRAIIFSYGESTIKYLYYSSNTWYEKKISLI